MSQRRQINRWLGSGIACLAAVFAVSRCGTGWRSRGLRADRGVPAGDVARRAMPGTTLGAGVATAAAVVHAAAAASEVEQRIRTAPAIIAAPIADPAGEIGRASCRERV